MDTLASEWIEEGKKIGLREGRNEGLKEGLKEGRIKTQQALILQILRHRFQLSDEVAQPLERQLGQVTDESLLGNLVNLALGAFTLAEFGGQLQGLLSAAKPMNG